MNENWQSIWNNSERLHYFILELLLKADGFDTPTGNLPVSVWIKYTSEIYNLIGINDTDKVIEIGCGSGAFLYPLYLKNINVSGVDYSKELIDLANKFFINSNFCYSDALDYLKSEKENYNIILSHGVFLYFPDLDYSEKVLSKMISLSKDKVAVLDICDFDKEEIYKKERIKKYQEKGFTKEDYDKKYSGLNHLFFKKDWFRNYAEKHNLKVEIFDQNCKEYYNSRYRFNVIFHKN